ncbi:MAG: hypothetical protein KY476_12035 [Planctomycetes bacterium]|nr:hypothetical protein [Planctomycetota bacterium]
MIRPETRRSAAWALWGGVALVAVVLVWRRFAGAFRNDPSALAAVVFPALAALAGAGAWWLFVSAGSLPRTRWLRIGLSLTALLPALVLAVALLPPASTAAVAWLTVLFALVAAALAGVGECAASGCPAAATIGWLGGNARGASAVPMAARWPASEAIAPGDAPKPEAPGPKGPSPEELSSQHWMRRSTKPDGVDRLEGAVTVSFAGGLKTAAAHIPVWPPFNSPPEVECEPVAAVPVEATVAAVHTYGFRIDLRRNSIAERLGDVVIGFSASAAAVPHPDGSTATGAE